MPDNQSKEYINPTSLGEMLKETYAKVDKANNRITLLASDVSSTTEAIKKTVKQVDVEYYLSTSATTTTGGFWSVKAPTWEEDKYMWSRQKVTYTDGTSITRNETCIAGAKGADGSSGRGITSITTEYYLSDSKTAPLGGEWTETQPEWEKNKYIWTRTKIVYNNPDSTEYTTPVCDAGWAAINSLEGKVETNIQDIAQLKVEKDNINASVAQITTKQEILTQQNQSNTEAIEVLTQKSEATMTAEEITFAISTEVEKGANKVITAKGFKFDDNGLTISDINSELSTNIDEDGMSILRNVDEVLTVDNTGVKATNLEATTYLIIGDNNIFETYTDENGKNRIGCYWLY